MGLSSKPMRSIFSGEVKIEGDMNTGRKFQELFAKLDIDLEKQLARYTGDSIAHNISQFFRTGQEWSKESIETFRLNASEFLQEETRDLPARPEIDIFYAQVDKLRTDFDRLQSRIERTGKTVVASQELLMQLYEGIIKSWKEDKGFGFIQPSSGGKDIFIHIRDLKHSNYQPQQGDDICYKVVADKDGKTRAYDAFIKGQEISQQYRKKSF